MQTRTIILLGIAAAMLLLAGGGAAVYTMTRGLRNNNPGNIRRGASQWLGMAPEQTDPDFVQFVSPEYGIRALMSVLRTYRTRYGLNTINGIIARWAPPSENDTAAYIRSVSQQTGIPANAVLAEADYPAVVAAIIKHENGVNPYTMATINNGVALA